MGVTTSLHRRIPEAAALAPATHHWCAICPDVAVRRTWARRRDLPADLVADRLPAETDPVTLSWLARHPAAAPALPDLLTHPHARVVAAAVAHPECPDTDGTAAVRRLLRTGNGHAAVASALRRLARADLLPDRPQLLTACVEHGNVTVLTAAAPHLVDPADHDRYHHRLTDLPGLPGHLARHPDLLLRWPTPTDPGTDLAAALAGHGNSAPDPVLAAWVAPGAEALLAVFTEQWSRWTLTAYAAGARRPALQRALVRLIDQLWHHSTHPAAEPWAHKLINALVANPWLDPSIRAFLISAEPAAREVWHRQLQRRTLTAPQAQLAWAAAVELGDSTFTGPVAAAARDRSVLETLLAAGVPAAAALSHPAADLALALDAPAPVALARFHDPAALWTWVDTQTRAALPDMTPARQQVVLEAVLGSFTAPLRHLGTVLAAFTA